VDRHSRGFTRLLNHKSFNWNFEMEAEEGMAGRASLRGGRTLAARARQRMLYVRGQPLDTTPGASSAIAAGPIRRSCLLQEVGEFRARRRRQPRHGGPLNVADMCDTHELCDAFIDAASASGYPKNKDYNNGDQEGFGYYQVTMKNGKRHRRRAPS